MMRSMCGMLFRDGRRFSAGYPMLVRIVLSLCLVGACTSCGGADPELDVGAEGTIIELDSEELATRQLVADLGDRFRDFTVDDAGPTANLLSDDDAVKAALDFIGVEPTSYVVRFGTYSRARLLEGQPEVVSNASELSKTLTVYVVTCFGVRTPSLGGSGAPDATEMNIVVDALTGEVIEGISYK